MRAGRARGLVSSRVSGRRVHAHQVPPPPELAGTVACLWVGRWDLPPDAPHVSEMLGDPSVHLCFEQATPVQALSHRVVGVWTRLWTRTLAGQGHVHAAKLRPGAAGAFVENASVLRNAVVDLRTVCSEGADHPDLLSGEDERSWAAISALLVRWQRVTDETALAVAACGHVADDPTLLRVEHLARRMGLSPRSVQRLFRRHVGAPPKAIIRRHRLQEVAVRLERGLATDLTELAYDLGYADHAHLTRDFKAAVGKPPGAFVADVHR